MNVPELIQNLEQSLKVARQAIYAWSADGPRLVPAGVPPLTHAPASSAQAAWEDDGGSQAAATLFNLGSLWIPRG